MESYWCRNSEATQVYLVGSGLGLRVRVLATGAFLLEGALEAAPVAAKSAGNLNSKAISLGTELTAPKPYLNPE